MSVFVCMCKKRREKRERGWEEIHDHMGTFITHEFKMVSATAKLNKEMRSEMDDVIYTPLTTRWREGNEIRTAVER